MYAGVPSINSLNAIYNFQVSTEKDWNSLFVSLVTEEVFEYEFVYRTSRGFTLTF